MTDYAEHRPSPLAASLEHDLAQLREKIPQEYATVQLIDRIEERLVGALDRIGARFYHFP